MANGLGTGEDLAEEGESLLGGERGGAASGVGHELQGSRQLVALRPLEEGAQAVSFVGGVLGDPCVEMRLTAAGQVEVPVGEPGQEAGGVDDLLAGVAPVGGRDELGLGDAAQAGQDLPGGEPADDLDVVGIGDVVEVVDEPALQQADLLVDLGEQSACHQELAQVGGGLPVRQLVKGFVGELDAAICQVAEHVRAVLLVEPGQPGERVLHADQGVEQRQQGGTDLAGAVVE
ncbi:hypothetical protein ABT294_34845 [Nonomuraea sp. NPDC000554]|uniref:hypothetical protein n=1 Tax=Nonomuraea sp. NPDC000554 TaxID=3154259 RepID=UPI003316A13D